MNILLIEVSVVITIGWATTLYFVMRRWLFQRRAWQWWHKQQVGQRHHQAESIRDGLLQQTFAFRRYLESALSTQPEAEQTERWLTRLETFYQSLERLSNELSPPFMADSLPLALQFMAKDWQQSHAGLTVQSDLPSDWSHGSSDNHKIILSIMTELIHLLIPVEEISQCLQLRLVSQGSLCTLLFKLVGDESQRMQHFVSASEVQYLKEIFHSLTAGKLELSYENRSLTGQLCWRDR